MSFLKKDLTKAGTGTTTKHEEKAMGETEKTRSVRSDDSKRVSGVSANGTILTSITMAPTAQSSFASDSSKVSNACPRRRKSPGYQCHHKDSMLVAQSTDKKEATTVDEATRLRMIMARSKNLPTTSYFSSNHILVNQERLHHTIAPLNRVLQLDELARHHAVQMASKEMVHFLDLTPLVVALKDLNCRRLGVNVQKGQSIRGIHRVMMKAQLNKNNILNRKFTHMGMGTAVGRNGELYLCQIFAGFLKNAILMEV